MKLLTFRCRSVVELLCSIKSCYVARSFIITVKFCQKNVIKVIKLNNICRWIPKIFHVIKSNFCPKFLFVLKYVRKLFNTPLFTSTYYKTISMFIIFCYSSYFLLRVSMKEMWRKVNAASNTSCFIINNWLFIRIMSYLLMYLIPYSSFKMKSKTSHSV